MQVLVAVFLLIAGGLYFTTGIRLGMVTMMPTTMFGAKGVSEYKLRTHEMGSRVGANGTCEAKKGSVEFVMVGPDGKLHQKALCRSGKKVKINVMAGGKPGMYKLRATYKNFDGKVELVEARDGGSEAY